MIAFLVLSGIKATAQPAAYPQLTSGEHNKQLSKQSPTPLFFPTIKKDSVAIIPAQSRLPLNFYSQHLGAACKMELQMEKQTKLPIRIRLGSKEQVDYLEGKFIKNR